MAKMALSFDFFINNEQKIHIILNYYFIDLKSQPSNNFEENNSFMYWLIMIY